MDKKQLKDFFLENEINFKKYFKFEELVFNCWKQHKSSEKKEMINSCFDRYSEFASYKEKFLLERKQFRIEPWLLQPLFKELYNKYFKVELKPDKNGFNSFGRKINLIL
jgi:hypothetical protein